MAPRMLSSVPFAAGPSLLRFHPRISGTLLLASASGVFTLADAQGMSGGSPHHACSARRHGSLHSSLLTADVACASPAALPCML